MLGLYNPVGTNQLRTKAITCAMGRLWSRVLHTMCLVPLFYKLHLNCCQWSSRFNSMSSLPAWHSFICQTSWNKIGCQGDCQDKFVPILLQMLGRRTRVLFTGDPILQARATLLWNFPSRIFFPLSELPEIPIDENKLQLPLQGSSRRLSILSSLHCKPKLEKLLD